MNSSSPEATLEDLLADPIIQLVMERDNVFADDVRQSIQKVWKHKVALTERDGSVKYKYYSNKPKFTARNKSFDFFFYAEFISERSLSQQDLAARQRGIDSFPGRRQGVFDMENALAQIAALDIAGRLQGLQPGGEHACGYAWRKLAPQCTEAQRAMPGQGENDMAHPLPREEFEERVGEAALIPGHVTLLVCARHPEAVSRT